MYSYTTACRNIYFCGSEMYYPPSVATISSIWPSFGSSVGVKRLSSKFLFCYTMYRGIVAGRVDEVLGMCCLIRQLWENLFGGKLWKRPWAYLAPPSSLWGGKVG